MENSQFLIGNGNRVNFFLDNWSGDTFAKKLNISEIFHSSLTIKDGEFLQDNDWVFPANMLLDFPSLSNLVSCVLPDVESEDTLVWQHSDNGLLSLKQSFDFLKCPSPKYFWKKFPWNPHIPPSHSMMVWRLL